MVNDEQYEFVRGVGSDEELEKYRKCFADNGSDKSIEVLKWFHQQNLPGLRAWAASNLLCDRQEVGGCCRYLYLFAHETKMHG